MAIGDFASERIAEVLRSFTCVTFDFPRIQRITGLPADSGGVHGVSMASLQHACTRRIRENRRTVGNSQHTGDKSVTPEPYLLSNGSVGKRLLNVEEAARYLGLKVDTVYKMARLRQLPSVKVRRSLRFDVRALELYVEQHTIETID